MADYSDTVTVTLKKKPITATVNTITGANYSKVYDGTTSFTDVPLTLTGVETGDAVTGIANGTVTDANAGTGKQFTATIVNFEGADKDYYSPPSVVSGTVDILPLGSSGTLTVTYADGSAIPADGAVSGETVKLNLQIAKSVSSRTASAAEQKARFYIGTSNADTVIGYVDVGSDGIATCEYKIPDTQNTNKVDFFVEYGMATVNGEPLSEGSAGGSVAVAAMAELTASDGAKVGVYFNIGDAIEAANDQSGCTLKLLRDSTTSLTGLTSPDLEITGVFTLDLNGKTLTTNGESYSYLNLTNENSHLTVKDSDTGGKIQGVSAYALFAQKGKVTVESGILETKASSYSALSGYEASTIIINGGIFKNGPGGMMNINGTAVLTGGTFYNGVIVTADKTVADSLEKGYVYYAGETASGTVVDGKVQLIQQTVTVGKCTHSWTEWALQADGRYTRTCKNDCKADDATETAVAKLEIGGATTYYKDLATAFSEANGNTATITLLKDMDADGLTLSSGKITLDLNGKTIETSSNTLLTISGADVTVQNGTLKHKDRYYTISVTSGKLLLKSDVTVSSFMDYRCGLFMTGGTATIDGASFVNGWQSVWMNGGSLIINSGTFAGTVAVDGGSLQCKGGNFADARIDGSWTFEGIKIGNSCDKTLADLLADGYAFRSKADGKAWISEVSGQVLSNVTVEKAPTKITTQPQNKTIYYGYTNETLSLTATAVDSSKAITYQWYSVGTGAGGTDEAITTATTSTLTIPQDKALGDYQYYCKLTCDGYELKSYTATVTVAKSGTAFEGGITTDKADNTVTYGETITVSVTPKATGNAPATFRAFAVAPKANEMALFVVKDGVETQITDPQAVVSGTEVTFTINTSEKTLAIGANTIMAKYVGNTNMADYSDTVTVTLKKKPITATVIADTTKVYNGTTAFTGVALTLNASDILNGDTVTGIANGNAASANVGSHAFTATYATLNGTDAGYYTLARAVSGNVTITKASVTGISQEYPVVKELAKEYEFTLANLLPSITATQEFGTVSYTVGTVTNTDNVLTKNPTDSDIADGKLKLSVANVADQDKTAKVTISMTTNNFTVTDAVITVKTVDKKPLTISDVAMPNREYNAVAYSYEGTPTFIDNTDNSTVTDVTFTKEYEGTATTSYTKSTTAPTNAGSYNLILTVSGKSAETYDGTLTIPFEITKKEVTVTAKDKDILVGEAVPSLASPVLDTDYTTDGFVGNDTLGGTVSMSYDGTVDNTQHGSYPITISGGTVSGNYTVKYVSGTLSITIDLTVINTAIAAANEAKTGIKIVDSPASSVANGTKFVTTAEMNALTTAIQTATEAKATVTTLAQAQAAAAALNDAVTAFKAAIKTGTYISDNDDDDSSGGGGSSSGGGSITTPPANKPNTPTEGEIKVNGKVDANGNASVSITDKNINDAYNKALADAKKNGNEQNGITLVINVNTGNKTATSLTVNLPKTVQDTIISNKVVNTVVVVDNHDIKIGMDLATVKEINKQAKADVSITATKADSSKLSSSAKTAIGTRPVFDLAVNYGSGKQVTSFGTGSVSVSIPYALGANEKAGNVQAVYVDANGNVQWLTSSVYDSVNKVVRFSTNHFSTYGIGYKTTNTAFTDITNHWAKENIEFVVSRGLFSGTSATTFSPNTAMTRGMFVTALGRLAEADVSKYTKSSFTDVKADAYYMGYVEWAVEHGIIYGFGNKEFAPNQSITREQMAVIMQNYAKAIGFTLPKVHAETTFADNAKIGAWSKDAVKAMQMAGVISGKDGNKFDPQGTATRAEVSTVLRRFVELMIDSDTAQGWMMNDSGKWMYYENGKAVTGKKTIGGVSYTFDQYGVINDTPKDLTYGMHTVVKNESWWSIASKYKCSMFELARINNKTIFSMLYVGDTLKVPESK